MKRLTTILIAALLSIAALGQNSIKVQAPNLVGVNEQFNITFIISGEHAPSDFSWEPGNDFQLVWGPQRGSSTSISIVNGKRTTSSQTTYTYVLLPKGTGRFQIEAAEATVKGDRLSSSRPTIEVVSDGAAASSQGQGGRQQSQGQGNQGGGSTAGSAQVSGEDMFLRLSLSKRSAMVGETITATLKLYQRVNIAGFEDARFPTFNGFWSQEIQAPTNIEFHRESVGEKIYNAAVLRSWNLVPQKAGDITVDAAELVCLVNVRTPRASTGSIFDSFFQDDYQTIRKRVSTAPVTIHVSGLPAGAPASFGGGVGSFKMSAALTRDSLKTHDAASLRITVTGSGNTSLLEAPKISFPPDFEVYDVKVSDTGGGKTFEYPFIPRSHGDFTIGPVEYSYFDIASRKYVTLRSQALPIRVERGTDLSGSGGGQIVQGVNRRDVRDVGSDIRFISTKPAALSAIGHFFVGSPAFWILSALLLLLAAAAWFSLRTLAARRADVVGSKNRAATKMARKRLSQAGSFLKGNLYTAFYEELHRALLGFISDKFNLDAADMSKENISDRLVENGTPEGLAAEFIGLLDACEFARYAPDSGHEAMNSHYETAVSVISAIDDSMKRNPRKGNGAAAALLALFLLLPTQRGAAQQTAYTDSLWTQGTAAYSDGDWATAAKAWSDIRALGLESPDLYYNLGNACFKQDDLAHAILNYERALKLDPSYSDARFNLEFAQGLVQDKIEAVPEFFLSIWARKLCWLLPSNTWAVLFLILLAGTLGCVLLFLLGRSVAARRSGFITGIVALVLSLLCLHFAFWQRTDFRKADGAIVVRAVTTVQSSPGRDSAKDLFVLHEGTKVKLLDSVGEWRNIELADGRQGWLPEADLEVI
ncbi:MAG: tetratricopeptide repeat protein [Bacteroidales bacterium]|jgi:tetratricopeptide (TPR) repeat protein|nr:tetratricopeptide repeat protein [Bacteroidales bacterium]